MHVKCPWCETIKNTGDWSRFKVFECDGCHRCFRGLHAEPARRWLLADWLNPFNVESFANWDHTACPNCGVMMRIYYSQTHTGFDNPSVCKACTREVPTWQSDCAPDGLYASSQGV